MNISSSLLSLTHKICHWLHETFSRGSISFTSVVAITLFSAYVLLVVAAYYSSISPGQLQLRIGLREDSPYVSWVMPAGRAWGQGARSGMMVLSADGQSLLGADLKTLPSEAITTADLLTDAGEVLHVEVTKLPHEQSPMKFSLWIISGMFALLGTVVVLRRPDLHAAIMFALFAGFTAFALAVIPTVGEPLLQWIPLIQFLTIAGVGATLTPFVLSLLGRTFMPYRSVVSLGFAAIGLVVSGGFVASIIAIPSAYQLVRPALFSYLSLSVVGAVVLILLKGIRQRSSLSHQQARIALLGILLGTLPVVGFTLVPEALGQKALFPVHLTLLSLGIVPLSFAYAILQHQMLGIRRLVHRGMVYGIISFVLLMLVIAGLIVGTSLLGKEASSGYSPSVIAFLVVGSVILFVPLRAGVRWLVDRLIYRDMFDYQAFINLVDRDLIASSRSQDIARELNYRLGKALKLESSLLFLGPQPSQVQRVASVGERAEEIANQIHPRLQPYIEGSVSRDLSELHWESDSLILATLKVSGKYLGYILLGPKTGGEVFLDEERRLIASLAPLLALAIDKNMLSEELRELNQRLVKAEEMERARIAADLHDGPLQKAILITGMGKGIVGDPRELAQQIVNDLREISSRLRPAILDDLGLVPALEWLLDSVLQRSAIQTHLSLHNVDEQERFSPDAELALFRVAQEATNNVVKHAKATRLDVSLSREAKNLVLQVADNGVGFHLLAIGKGGTGLPEMRERVMQLNGSFGIVATPEMGAIVIARIPWLLTSRK